MKLISLRYHLVPGATIVARTRLGGLRRLTVRVIGDGWIIGHNAHGICHRVRTDQIVHAER